jgi:hypothetical protein
MGTLTPTRRNLAAAISLCAALFLPARTAAPQASPGSPELRQTLDRLGAVAQSLEHSLPSITCVETGVSEALKKGKVKKQVQFAANLRAIRIPGAGLHESFTLTRINGKPYSKPGYSFPFYAGEAFDSAVVYFQLSHQPCYIYSLSPGRIDFQTAPGAGARLPCRDDGVRGFALLDAAGDVTHVERTVPETSTRNFNLAPFAAIDLAPIELNGHAYQLVRHVVSETYRDDITGRFEATYSNCQLFTASVTILPGAQIVPDTSQSPK